MGPLVKKKNADDCFDLIGIKPTQVGKLLEWMQERGVEVEDTTAATLKDLLAKDSTPDIVKTVIKHRQIASKTSVAKYDTARGAICNDDRLRGMFLFHGAGTGRWTGKLVQLHNLPRGNVKDTDSACDMLAECNDLDFVSSMYPDVMGLFSSCIRGLMKAPAGKQFYVADYAGIEARVLGWMAGEENYQKAFRAKSDLYKVQASGIYGVPYESVTGEQRQLGKAAVLGLGYQMGLKTFATTCENWGIKVDEQVLADAHAGYRRANNKIVEMWGALDRAATATVKTGRMHSTHMVTYGLTRDRKFLLCKLPSGRFLSYPFPKLVDGTFGGKQVSACAIKEGQWVRRSLYGGLYCENAIQAVARDLLRDGMQAVQDDGRWNIVGHVHDECIAEGDIGHDIKDFEDLLANQPKWAEGCIYHAEGWEGPRFKKG
jgi:DNA polymerase